MKNKHQKWPKIKAFHYVIDHVRHIQEKFSVYDSTLYRPKIKLHGTNAGIQIYPDGNIIPQGRNRILYNGSVIGRDQNGFAAWVMSHKDEFIDMKQEFPFVLYGEWCGPGIHKKAAITQISQKIFAVYAIKTNNGDTSGIIVDPEDIAKIMGNSIENLYVIPYHKQSSIVANWHDNVLLQETIDNVINPIVNEVEECDPFVKNNFDIDGIGEGVVFYPQIEQDNFDSYTKLLFKAKGEKFIVAQGEKAAKIKADVPPNAMAFVEKFVTENRLEQGLDEVCNGEARMENTKDFLTWVQKDIQSESEMELEMSGLVWKQVGKLISRKSVKWFKDKAKLLK